MLSSLLPGLGFGFTASIMPGPLQAFLLFNTLGGGWRRGLWVVPAPLVSDAPIVALCLLALSQARPSLLRMLSACGALFLAWLAFAAFKELRAAPGGGDPTPEPRGGGPWILGRAALLNGVGPGPWVFWTSVMGPLVVDYWRDSPARAILVVVGFYGSFLACMSAQVALFSQARRLGEKAVRAGRWLGLGLLVLFAGWLALRAAGVASPGP